MNTILLIEDDKTLRENTSDFLSEEGFRVLTAEDGLIGVQLAIKHLPDLILCDISMPNMNGYDFYKTIQQINATSTIPLVFLTARTEKEDVRAGMQLGADDYITKPFDFSELLKVVKIRLAKQQRIIAVNDEKFYALIDNPQIGVYIYSNGKFIYNNSALAKVFGYDQEEFNNLSLEEIIDDGYRENVFTEINKCFNGIKNTIHTKFDAIHKTLDKVTVELYGTVINYNGEASIIGNITSVNKDSDEQAISKKHTDNLEKLSRREQEVLELICKGYSTTDVATALFISQRTVDTHRANLLAKSGSKNIAELIMYAIRNRLITLE